MIPKSNIISLTEKEHMELLKSPFKEHFKI